MSIRLVTHADRQDYLQLVADYLTELHDLGSDIIPSPRSLSFWERLFNIAANEPDSMESIVLLVESDVTGAIIGFCTASAMPPVWDSEFGKTAFGHGTYIKREHRCVGCALVLRDAMRAELTKRGFETVMGGVHIGNKIGAKSLASAPNWRWHQVVGYERLQ